MASPTSFYRSSVAAVLVAGLLAGCSRNGPAELGLAQWAAVEEVRIGGTGDPEQPLTQVAALAVDGGGSVYVAQVQEGVIKVFDDEGRRVRDIGRRGSEPGEFDRIYGLGFVADTLYAIDFGQRRLSYFSTDGEVLRTQEISPPPASPPFYPGMPFAVFADGSMAVGTAFASTISADDLRRVPQLRVDPARQIADTVTWIALERTGRRAEYEGRPLPVGSPLSDDAFAMFARDGSRVVTVDRTVASGPDSASFGLTVTDGWGDTIYTRRYAYEPVPVADQVLYDVVSNGALRLQNVFSSPVDAQTFVRSAMFLPVHYPPVTTAAFSDDGSLWLRREAVPDRPQRWLVVDEAGEPLAETTLPERLDVMVIRAEAIWGVLPDDQNVPYVVRYRIER